MEGNTSMQVGTATDQGEIQTRKKNSYRLSKKTTPLVYPPTTIAMLGDMHFDQVTGSSTVIYVRGT